MADIRAIKLLQKEDVHIEEKLGKGGFGTVFKGKLNRSEVAIKIDSADGEDQYSVRNEAKRLW